VIEDRVGIVNIGSDLRGYVLEHGHFENQCRQFRFDSQDKLLV